MSQCIDDSYQQVSGGSCSLTMYMEAAPGCVETGEPGVRLAFYSENFGRGSSKQQRQVITGKRGPGKPYEGLPQMTGACEAAAYAGQIGYLARALCGAAVTTAEPSRALDSAAVVQIRPGIVGLPCASHGFAQDAVITVAGTANYDGQYRVERGVTADLIAVSAPYAAEILSGGTAHRGRAPLLTGEAVDLGDGSVALPVSGEHSLNPGESVRISGSFSYDGTHVLLPATEPSRLVIGAAYEPESFDGATLAVPVFYRHVFTLPRRQPTVCMEKYLDYEDGAAVNRYQRFGYCKVNGWNFTCGGAEELRLSLDFAVGRQEDASAPLDAAPLNPAAIPMDNIECALWVNGERVGDVESCAVTNTFGIEPKAAIGDRGQYSRMPEGDPECRAALTVFLETDRYDSLARGRYTIPLAVSNCSASGDEYWFHYPEVEMDVPGTGISGKQGIMQEASAMAFVDRAESILSMELINRVSAYM